jgi:hypothetical protein
VADSDGRIQGLAWGGVDDAGQSDHDFRRYRAS